MLRLGEGVLDPDCVGVDDPEAPGPCWTSRRYLDVFDLGGDYLGAVEVPGDVGFTPPPFIDDELLVVQGHDAAGTPFVKLFRLELSPGSR